MPKITEHKEARLRRIIRDIMAIDPLINLRSLKDAVEVKINRTIDIDYLSKLVKSVSREMSVVADKEKVEERITYLRETNRIVREELFRIAFPDHKTFPQPDVQQRTRALDLISKMDRAQVKIEMDLGLFTRHLGELDINIRAKPIDEQSRMKMIEAWKNWFGTTETRRKVEPLKKETPKITDAIVTEKPATTPPTGATIPRTENAGLVATE